MDKKNMETLMKLDKEKLAGIVLSQIEYLSKLKKSLSQTVRFIEDQDSAVLRDLRPGD